VAMPLSRSSQPNSALVHSNIASVLRRRTEALIVHDATNRQPENLYTRPPLESRMAR